MPPLSGSGPVASETLSGADGSGSVGLVVPADAVVFSVGLSVGAAVGFSFGLPLVLVPPVGRVPDVCTLSKVMSLFLPFPSSAVVAAVGFALPIVSRTV